MNHGLSEKTAAQIQAVFAKYPQVEKAILYGSRAKGNYKNGSDVDLTLVGAGLTPGIVDQIRDELDEQPFPHRFDISLLSEIKHVELIAHIQRTGVTFYESVQTMRAHERD